MIYLYIFAVVTVIALAYMRFEAGFLEVNRICHAKGKENFKIIQLSDIHIPFLKVSSKKVRRVIEKENPDAIILTGDYIHKKSDIPDFLKFIEEIKLKDNIYLCFGNHDYKPFVKKDTEGLNKYIDAVSAMGVRILHNDCACIQKNSKSYNIIGIADIRYGFHDIGKALSSCSSEAFMNIAFSHNPNIVLHIPEKRFDYLLCGHFHGGQIWAPFGFEFRVLRQERLYEMGMTRGLHMLKGTHVYISRGLGNVWVPLRFMSRPEVTVFHLP